eukprot:405641-Pelagomonas_calceolata.AAC.1
MGPSMNSGMTAEARKVVLCAQRWTWSVMICNHNTCQVREVREAAREAVALLEVLRAYSTGGGGGAGGWDAHARRAMAARGEQLSHQILILHIAGGQTMSMQEIVGCKRWEHACTDPDLYAAHTPCLISLDLAFGKRARGGQLSDYSPLLTPY